MQIYDYLYIQKGNRYLIYLLLIILSISLVNCLDESTDKTPQETTITTTTTTTKKPIDPIKEIKLCELSLFQDEVGSDCNLIAFNFTFYAYFSLKRTKRLAISNLKELTDTLSESSSCEINYLKYNFWSESLDYMNSTEERLFQDPEFQNKIKAKVYIISDGEKKYRKTVIYECLLPKSDVYLSLKPIASRFSQSRPIGLEKVTVSGFHVKLNFLPLNGINVNVETKTRVLRSDDKKPTKSAQKFIIFYHNKCRNCFVNIHSTTVNEFEVLDPFSYRSIRCQMKPKSCVYDGKCYYDDEKIDSTEENSDYACNMYYMMNHHLEIDLDK